MYQAQSQQPEETPVPNTAGVRHLTSRTAIIDFFELVMDEQLLFPAVVVTRPTTADEPFIPLDELYAAVGDFADVYYLDSSTAVRDIVGRNGGAHSLDDVNVYGGATRVFPAGQWNSAHMFLARTPSEGRDQIRRIAGHLRKNSGARGSISYSTSTEQAAVADEVHRVSATVRVVDLEAENAALRQELSRLATAPAKSAPKPKAPVTNPVPVQKSTRRMFADAGDEIRFRVMVLWAEQTTPQEKLAAPLPKYALGPEFAATLEALAGANSPLFDKVARCALRILLGQDRDGHKLDPSGKTREDGAVAWRSYVEQKTASARRLHFWRLPGGGIEFSRVVLHDDYTP